MHYENSFKYARCVQTFPLKKLICLLECQKIFSVKLKFDSLNLPTEPTRKPNSPRRRTKLEKYRQERAAAQTGSFQGLDVTQDDFFILIEVDELKYQLEVKSVFEISVPLCAPH